MVVAVFAPGYGRIVRTQTIALRNAEFVLATRALGAGVARMLAVHILPNIIGPVLIIACMDIPVVITIEAGMSFLGLGVPPPTPSWGTHPQRRPELHPGFALARRSPAGCR